jgi:shikimate kinase
MNVQTAEPAQAPTASQTAPLPPHIRRIVLTGFMGAGKTTVGRLLAAQLNWEFLDLDAYLEDRTGSTVPRIFAEHGEAHFRRLESTALASALGRSNVVLALGGGTPEILTNRLLLEQTPSTFTVFLDAPFPALFDRCMLQALNPGMPARPEQARPLLTDPATAEARFTARQPIYRRLARLTLLTADLSPDQTASTLLTRISVAPPPRR